MRKILFLTAIITLAGLLCLSGGSIMGTAQRVGGDGAGFEGWGQTVIVAKSGGDYVSINEAYTYAKTLSPSATNRIMVKVMPGTYNESLVMDTSYIDLIGASRYTTTISTAIAGYTVYMQKANSLLKSFTISNTIGDSSYYAITQDEAATIQDCYIANLTGSARGIETLVGKLLDSEIYIDQNNCIKDTGAASVIRNCRMWGTFVISNNHYGTVESSYLNSHDSNINTCKSGSLISNSVLIVRSGGNDSLIGHFQSGAKISNSFLWQQNDIWCVVCDKPISGTIVQSHLQVDGATCPIFRIGSGTGSTSTVYLADVSSNKGLNGTAEVIVNWLSSHYEILIATATPSTDVGTGAMYFDNDDYCVYVNTGTAAAPSWQKVGSQ